MPAKRRNGASHAPDSVSTFVAMMQGPAASSFAMSQRFALESAKFWARRMRAYADQMETLACCNSAEDIATAHQHFLERMRDDYAEETRTFGALLTPAESEREQPGEAG